MTTKYPLGVVLMELACQAGRKRASMRARWIPRLQNEEADALTNGEFHHFQKANRIEVDLGKLKFLVMDSLFELGEEYVAELAALKAAEKRKTDAGGKTPGKKRRKSPPMRESRPW